MHEAWLRLAEYTTEHELSGTERRLLACTVMRRVLTDHARARRRDKRGGERRAPLPAEASGGGALRSVGEEGAALVLEVDEALSGLATQDPELARVVELRFFGGCTLEEIAELCGVSLRTANRRWQLARAWLLEALADEETAGGTPLAGGGR